MRVAIREGWCLSTTTTIGPFGLGVCCCPLNQTVYNSMAITRKALVTILKLNVPIAWVISLGVCACCSFAIRPIWAPGQMRWPLAKPQVGRQTLRTCEPIK